MTRYAFALALMAACGTSAHSSKVEEAANAGSDSISAASAQPAVPAGALSVYKDGLDSGWADWSWSLAADDDLNTSTCMGKSALKAVFGTGGGIKLEHDDANYNDVEIPASSFATLTMYLNPGLTAAKLANLSVTLDNGATFPSGSKASLVATYATLTVNAWTKVQIPLAAINPQKQPFHAIVLTDADGATLFVDAVFFETAVVTPPPPPPSTQLDVFTSAFVNGWTDTGSWFEHEGIENGVLHVSAGALASDNWEGLQLNAPAPIPLTKYQTLSFVAKGNGRMLIRCGADADGVTITLTGTMSAYTLNVSDIAKSTFSQIYIKNWDPGASFYFENIALETAATGTSGGSSAGGTTGSTTGGTTGTTTGGTTGTTTGGTTGSTTGGTTGTTTGGTTGTTTGGTTGSTTGGTTGSTTGGADTTVIQTDFSTALTPGNANNVTNVPYRIFRQKDATATNRKGLVLFGDGNNENAPSQGSLGNGMQNTTALALAKLGYVAVIVAYQAGQASPTLAYWNENTLQLTTDMNNVANRVIANFGPGLSRARTLMSGVSYTTYSLYSNASSASPIHDVKGILGACGATDSAKASSFVLPVYSLYCVVNGYPYEAQDPPADEEGASLISSINDSTARNASVNAPDTSCSSHCGGNAASWSAKLVTQTQAWLP